MKNNLKSKFFSFEISPKFNYDYEFNLNKSFELIKSDTLTVPSKIKKQINSYIENENLTEVCMKMVVGPQLDWSGCLYEGDLSSIKFEVWIHVTGIKSN